MAGYSVFADVGKTLVDLLRAGAVPEPVAKAEQIGLCSPQDRGGFVVGLHPYDMKEDAAARRLEPIPLPDGSLQDPPGAYTLSYIVSVASKAEAAAKAMDEQRILGRVLQLLRDNSRLPEAFMPPKLRAAGEPMAVELTPVELEEKVKVWSMFGEPCRPCAFFTVGPVLVESTVIRRPAPRVVRVELGAEQREGRR